MLNEPVNSVDPHGLESIGRDIASALDGLRSWMFNENHGGASEAAPVPARADLDEWIYGPENDPKINPDGSTEPSTWTTPDDYSSSEEAQDKLDPFKPASGRSKVCIPK
ncbi:MAG: hypothetical protein ACREA0_09355, partial [bacterium]